MIFSGGNENRQTTSDRRQTTFFLAESHKTVITALLPGNNSVKRLEFLTDNTVFILQPVEPVVQSPGRNAIQFVSIFFCAVARC